MEIFLLIIAIVAHLLTALLLMYSCDTAELWKDNVEIPLRQPSIHDLNNSADKYSINEYVKEIVCPSYYYFILKREIEELQEDRAVLAGITLQAFSFIFILKCATKVIPNHDLSKSLYGILIISLSLIVCCLGCYIIYKLYNKHCSIRNFSISIEELKKQFHYDKNGFDISEEDAFNNFIIYHHHNYLRFIEDSVRRRNGIKKILVKIGIIVYFLFFFHAPD